MHRERKPYLEGSEEWSVRFRHARKYSRVDKIADSRTECVRMRVCMAAIDRVSLLWLWETNFSPYADALIYRWWRIFVSIYTLYFVRSPRTSIFQNELPFDAFAKKYCATSERDTWVQESRFCSTMISVGLAILVFFFFFPSLAPILSLVRRSFRLRGFQTTQWHSSFDIQSWRVTHIVGFLCRGTNSFHAYRRKIAASCRHGSLRAHSIDIMKIGWRIGARLAASVMLTTPCCSLILSAM